MQAGGEPGHAVPDVPVDERAKPRDGEAVIHSASGSTS